MAQVQKLHSDTAELQHDRRVAAENAAAPGPPELSARVVLQDYQPAAVAGLLTIETLVIFAIGTVAAGLFGIPISGAYQLAIIVAAISFPIFTTFQGSFATRPRTTANVWGMRIIAPLAVSELAVLGLMWALPASLASTAPADLPRWLIAWFLTSYAAVGFLNSGFEIMFRRRERRGTAVRHVVVYGGGPHGQSFIGALTRHLSSLVTVDAFFDERTKSIPNRIGDIPFGGGAEELIAYVQHHAIEEIFVALPWSADARILDILRKFRPLPATVRLAPESALLHPALFSGEAIGRALAPIVRRTPLSPWGQFLKRILDRVVATLALLWLAPLFLGIAIAVKLTSRGPVFFRQNRLGFNNLPFSVFKFRTMRVAAQADETLKQARRRDSRVTAVGGFLRRWSLDELPQLFNVLRGDMSLVGPRPHPMWRQASDLWEQRGSEPLDAIIHEYAARHRVRPGITGWAQISGYRGETATIDRMHKRVELDIYYIDHWSLWFDIKIILRTFIALFQSQGAY